MRARPAGGSADCGSGLATRSCRCKWLALSEYKHHSSRVQSKDRAAGEAREILHGHVPEAPLPQGSRPPCLVEPREPQDKEQKHTVEHFADGVPMLTLLDNPVPQKVDQLVAVLARYDTPLLRATAGDGGGGSVTQVARGGHTGGKRPQATYSGTPPSGHRQPRAVCNTGQG